MNSLFLLSSLFVAYLGFSTAKYAYTNRQWKSSNFVSDQADHVIGTFKPEIHHVTLLLVRNAANSILSDKPVYGGFFKEPLHDLQLPADFCESPKNLFSADLDGDGLTDILCYDPATGTVTFMIAKSIVGYFNAVETIDATVFTCPSTGKFLIGDFDNNKAADLICIDSTTSIYFSKKICPTSDDSHQFKSQAYNHHPQSSKDTNYRKWHKHHFHCIESESEKLDINLGFTNCVTSVDDIVVGKVAIDEGDSLICLKEDGSEIEVLRPVLVSGRPTVDIFNRNQVSTSPSPVFCGTAKGKLVSADVDGDTLQELVCLDSEGGDAAIPTLFSNGQGNYAADTASVDNTVTGFCQPTGTIQSDPIYFVGDFDFDGKDDILCRYTIQTDNVFTEIVYAEINNTL